MTYPNTEGSHGELSGPPDYPTSQMVPPEFWRKQPDGDPANTQTITVETPNGPQKRTVERGWTKTVTFSSDPEDE